MIGEAIRTVVEGKDLSFTQAQEVFEEIFENKCTPSQIAAFLIGLRVKGEDDQEIAAASVVIREKTEKLSIRERDLLNRESKEPVVDTCGTGGSGIDKFNISTATAFVVSSAGVKVAKHGNRGVSSKCGSADVLEAMGIKIIVEPKVMEEAIRQVGIGFLFAPLYHRVFKIVAPVRKEISIRTIFNIIGPLCNPAHPDIQLLGVFSVQLLSTVAKALKKLNVSRSFVVYSDTLKDEVSLSGETQVQFLNGSRITKFTLTPSDFGLKKCKVDDLLVTTPQESAKVIIDIFKGKKFPPRDVVSANAGCCFYLLKKVKSLKEGVSLAQQLIDSGKVYQKYIEFREFLEKQN